MDRKIIDKVKEKVFSSKLKKTLMLVGTVFSFILLLLGWQFGITHSAKQLYEKGEYVKAQERCIPLVFHNWLGNYKNKIEIMSNIYDCYNEAEKYRYGQSQLEFNISMGYYIDTVKVCIAYNDRAKLAGCTKELLNTRTNAAQILANEGYDLVEVLSQDRKVSVSYYPLEIENPDKVKELIIETADSISQDDIKTYQNIKNPIQITEKNSYRSGDYMYCTGTVSNVSDTTHYNVKVRVTYYSEDEEMLTSDWTYAVDSEGIRAGENQQFEIMTKVNGDAPKYKVEIFE